jgi:hypothetical protein
VEKNLPVYQYCTLAKPYLRYDERLGRYVESQKSDPTRDVNGKIAAKCVCRSYAVDDFSDGSKTESILRESEVPYDEYKRYSGSSPLCAISMENEKPLNPLPLSCFVDESGKRIASAPQSWRYAYVEAIPGMPMPPDSETIAINGKTFVKCVILSLRSHWLGELLEKRKTREIRKRVWLGMAEEPLRPAKGR